MSMISSLKSIILIFLIDVSSFVIKDRATGKYLAAKIDGKISAKPRLSQASKFKIFPNGKSIIDFAVMDKKTKKVLDYSGSGPDLIAYNYHGGKNQLFEFNLDENGFWQIIQNKVKYLYWDPHEEKFMGDKYDPETHHGFLLFQDDGVTPFPIHKNSEPVIPRFSSPYDIASPFNPFLFSRNPFLAPRSSFGFNSFSGGE